jgi:uncharacterized DUF497 family protein
VDPSFEWDPAKDAENQRKHGVSFVDAQLAFLDPSRVIARTFRTVKTSRGFIASVPRARASSPCGLRTAAK